MIVDAARRQMPSTMESSVPLMPLTANPPSSLSWTSSRSCCSRNRCLWVFNWNTRNWMYIRVSSSAVTYEMLKRSFSVLSRSSAASVVGMTSARHEMTSRETLYDALVRLNRWLDREFSPRMPEAKKHSPKTKSMLERIEPNRDDCTTLIRFSRNAAIDRIISTALPNPTVRRPPTIWFVCSASTSVVRPSTLLTGTMARKLLTNVMPGGSSSSRHSNPTGTKSSRVATHPSHTNDQMRDHCCSREPPLPSAKP
mmetsp:Transcript_27997/g.80610  ORF Transcript_27997/g.80610 Transcript_27997/m.80610 type:complete len:254 (-) Transcript_27997:253-1014(-)